MNSDSLKKWGREFSSSYNKGTMFHYPWDNLKKKLLKQAPMKPTRSLENTLKMCVPSLEIKKKIFLNAYDLQELNLQDVNNINKFITLKEMEAVHK